MHRRHRLAPEDRAICAIAPPDLLLKVAKEGDAEDRDAAVKALSAASAARAQRATMGNALRQLGIGLDSLGFTAASAEHHNTVYDAQHENTRPGVKARGDGDPESSDAAVNQAYDGAEDTYGFYKDVLGRDSLDGNGVELVSSVHYRRDLDNAMWNGEQMLYGDGSGRVFQKGSLTTALDVIGHELTHGVTEFTAGLVYHNQSGALNESMSDVFGSLVKQRKLGQSADQADWLIAPGILGSALHGDALRSMKSPGDAYDGDNQPAGMDSYRDMPDDETGDFGGVHTNSGIPNHAFYLAATAIGGNAWEVAGKIWYQTLSEKLRPRSDFAECANATVEVAGTVGSSERDAVENAWKEVGVL
jgi:Zn-dependent metalloprotease